MKAATFYFWDLEPIFIDFTYLFPFLTFMVDLTFGKILNIPTGRVRACKLPIQLQLTCKRFHFCKCAGEYPLKDAEQNSQKRPVIALIFKLKVLVICTEFDVSGEI